MCVNSDQYKNDSGVYFDNDKGRFSNAHSDAYDDEKINNLLTLTKDILDKIKEYSTILSDPDVLLGGETLEGPRYIWWNFVASSKERIEEAKEAWARGDWAQNDRFQLPPGDDQEFIPLPKR